MCIRDRYWATVKVQRRKHKLMWHHSLSKPRNILYQILQRNFWQHIQIFLRRSCRKSNWKEEGTRYISDITLQIIRNAPFTRFSTILLTSRPTVLLQRKATDVYILDFEAASPVRPSDITSAFQSYCCGLAEIDYCLYQCKTVKRRHLLLCVGHI